MYALPSPILLLADRQLSSKRQLRVVLLVSKRIYHAVLPLLYRFVSFTVDSSIGNYRANYRLLRMADKENQGLLHIREIQLYVRDEYKRSLYAMADYPDAVQLLAAIPRDSLSIFRWNSLHRIPAQVLRLLWTRQHKLTQAELVSCDSNLDQVIEELNICGHSFHEHITHLRLTEGGKGTIPTAAYQLLQARPNIDTLTLSFLRFAPEMVTQSQENEGQGQEHTYYQRLLKRLFAPPQPYRFAGPLSLREMNLYSVDLNDSPGHMFPAVNLAVLETLRVASCPGLYVMLTGMSNLPAASKPRIRRLQIYHEKPRLRHEWVSARDNTDRTLKSTNDFLLSMKDSLERVWIVMRGINSQDRLLNALAPGVAHHGASLEHLYLDVRSHQPPFHGEQCVGWFSGEVWEQVCASMGRLEALYVPFPPIVANEKLKCRHAFDHYLDCALQIPSLKALNIKTWPYPFFTQIYNPAVPRDPTPYISRPWQTSDPESVGMPWDFYDHCLLYLAEDIVLRRSELISNPHRHLEIVSFGIPEGGHSMVGLQDMLGETLFVKSSITYLGKEDIIMRQRGWQEIRETELRYLADEAVNINPIARRDDEGLSYDG
ncbi:MAG: hypothetical protein Q9212_005542 [Teloschistes hypoglaucus]